MADTTGVLARLQAALSTYDPSWDVGVGTATYKILEAVAQEIANANNNSTLQTYSYNINTKSGSDLDNFVNLFGIYRQLGKRAVGIVTFQTSPAATSIINIPLGTQVAVPIGGNYSSPIYFSTTAPAIIPIGSTQVNVPVIATLPGLFGNVAANTIITMATTLNGVTSITNPNPTTGGQDPESDSQLRSRWQSTAFNNTTGTNGKYILTALQNPNVSSANAISSQTFYDEQLVVQATISGGTSNNVTFQMVAYSGITNAVSGTVYSGTNVVTYSGFATSTNGTTLQTGLQNMVNSVVPNNAITVTVVPTGNTIATGLNIQFGGPSPYRFTIGSGSALNGGGVTNASGVVTISGTSYSEFLRSLNPDIGASGTQSYLAPYTNASYSGFLYPQGNELVGSNLNSSSQVVYTPYSDYYYNAGGTYTVSGTFSPQLYLPIINGSLSTGLFLGNTVEVISEYNPAASRVSTVTSGNYVDIFVDSTTAGNATEQSIYNASTNALSSGSSTRYLNSSNYVFANGTNAGTNGALFGSIAGDTYVPFDRQPLINFPSQFSTSSSGVADTVFWYSPTNGSTPGSGNTYPICANPYNFITFTGTVTAIPYYYISTSGVTSGTTVTGYTTSGVNFVSVANANTFLYPGLALASGTLTSGQPYWIQSVTTSGVYLNASASNSGTTTISGKALVYPLYDITPSGNSVQSMTSLVFDSSTPPNGWPTQPTGTSWVQYTHNYNQDVVDVEALIQQSRPFGVNTLVHQANFQNIIVNLRAVLTAGYALSNVQSNISNQIQSYFSYFSYLSPISFASLQSQILGVAGVYNAKVTSVSVAALDGTVLNTYQSDFILASNQLPLLYNINYTVVGASTF